MPNNIVNKVSKECEIPLDKVEQLWADAEKRVVEQYGKKNKKNFQLITGVFKHSLGKQCNAKLGWETQWSKTPLTEAVDFLIDIVSNIQKNKLKVGPG